MTAAGRFACHLAGEDVLAGGQVLRQFYDPAIGLNGERERESGKEPRLPATATRNNGIGDALCTRSLLVRQVGIDEPLYSLRGLAVLRRSGLLRSLQVAVVLPDVLDPAVRRSRFFLELRTRQLVATSCSIQRRRRRSRICPTRHRVDKDADFGARETQTDLSARFRRGPRAFAVPRDQGERLGVHNRHKRGTRDQCRVTQRGDDPTRKRILPLWRRGQPLWDVRNKVRLLRTDS